jgi:hypothetical protein
VQVYEKEENIWRGRKWRYPGILEDVEKVARLALRAHPAIIKATYRGLPLHYGHILHLQHISIRER